MTNVLFLHAGNSWIRGSENALLTVLRGLDRNLFCPSLVTSNGDLHRLAGTSGIASVLTPLSDLMIDGSERRCNVFRYLSSVQRVVSLARKQHTQVIYCNGGSTCQIGYYAGRLLRVPVIAHVHSPYNRRYVLLYRLHRADRVVFVSGAIERSIRAKQKFHGTCEVIHNGVDTDRFRPPAQRDRTWRERLSIPDDSVVFGQVSSLIERKGIDILLRAFAIVYRSRPNTRLVLVGDGAGRERFQRLATELRIADVVRFTGDQPDPLPFYQHVFDIHVLASRSDAFPLSPIEAAACGLPNIGAAVDGIPEQIEHEQTGLLFGGEDQQTLARHMLSLVCDRSYRKGLANAAIQAAVHQFSVEQFCGSVQRAISEAVIYSVPTGPQDCPSTAVGNTEPTLPPC